MIGWPKAGHQKMKRFAIGQKWRNDNAMHAPVFGEVIATSPQGRRGTVVITDERGRVLDTYRGSASQFQASGEWQLIED